MLIAADDALKSALEASNRTSKEVDKKFGDAIKLLGDFEKEFSVPSGDPTSDPKIGGTVTRKAEMGDKFESPATTLYALKKNLLSKVTSLIYYLPLNTDEYHQPMGNKWPKLTRVVKFYLLSSLPDTYPIVVKRGYHAIVIACSI